MHYRLTYTKQALDDLSDLPNKTGKRIFNKIEWFKNNNPIHSAKKLINPNYGTYRWRVGDYRVLFDVNSNGEIQILLILTIKHRKDVYEK